MMIWWKSRKERETELLREKRREERRMIKLRREKLRAIRAEELIANRGHRHFVGGHDAEEWYGIGRLQYHFLVSRGLLPHHCFLDIACGALRLGQFLIPYLQTGNYRGLEGEPSLVEAGLKRELQFGLAELRKPVFAFNYTFDFSFVDGFDYAIAQSLFTHLVADDIKLCFRNLRPKAGPDSKFFFTFFEGKSKRNPEGESHANISWRYSEEEMRSFAEAEGWHFNYIGDWNHPRDQKMGEARKR